MSKKLVKISLFSLKLVLKLWYEWVDVLFVCFYVSKDRLY